MSVKLKDFRINCSGIVIFGPFLFVGVFKDSWAAEKFDPWGMGER